MRPSYNRLNRQQVLFDGPRLIADAGLLLPAILAARLGLRQLLSRHVELGGRARRANVPTRG